MKNYVNDNAIIPFSVYDAIMMIQDNDTRRIAFETLILNALTDEFNLTNNPIVDMVLTMARPLQVSTKQRYKKAVENGKLGGRPIKVDREKVFELRKNGYTQNQIASELGCSTRTIIRVLNDECDISDITDDKTCHNLDIDKDVDKDKDIDVEVDTYVTTEPSGFDTTSTTTTAPASGATLSSKEERLFAGDVIYNLIRLFGKEKYYEENKAKYLKWVDKVFPNISKEPSSLELLTCALISLKARNFKIERTSDNDSFNYWVIDALNHVKKNNILVRYKDKILHQKSDEKLHFLELERKQTEVKEENYYDDEEDCELPF